MFSIKIRSFIFSLLVIFFSCSCYDGIPRRGTLLFKSLDYNSRLTIKFAKNITKKMKVKFFRKISFTPIAYNVFGYDIAEYNHRLYILEKNMDNYVKNALLSEKIKFIKFNVETKFGSEESAINKKRNIKKGNLTWQERLFDLKRSVKFIKNNKIRFKKYGVVMVDTAPDFNHQDIKKVIKYYNGKPLYWLSKSLKSNKVFDEHGTFISCLATGYRYKKWSADSYILPIIVRFGLNIEDSYLSDIAIGLKYYLELEKKGIVEFKVVNMSFMSHNNLGILHDAMEAMSDKLFVVASGNRFADDSSIAVSDIYPASWRLENKLTVTGINKLGVLSEDSKADHNYVDIASPIEERSCIVSGKNKDYKVLVGTSISTAIVSWGANILFSAYPDLSIDQIRLSMIWGAKRNHNLTLMVDQGRVFNLYQSLEYARLFQYFSSQE